MADANFVKVVDNVWKISMLLAMLQRTRMPFAPFSEMRTFVSHRGKMLFRPGKPGSHTHTHTEREREREREIMIHVHLDIYQGCTSRTNGVTSHIRAQNQVKKIIWKSEYIIIRINRGATNTYRDYDQGSHYFKLVFHVRVLGQSVLCNGSLG